MNTKKYFSALILILAFIGLYKAQPLAPNQQIVLQFANTQAASKEAKNALAIVTEQLQSIGIANIKVEEDEEKQLKITYYSAKDVASIKALLLKHNLQFDYTSQNEEKAPKDKKQNSYNLDICEIQNNSDTGSDLSGKYTLEVKQDDRFHNPNIYTYINKIDTSEKDRIVKVAYKINKNIAIAIDNTSHKIPEVRAGPLSNRNA